MRSLKRATVKALTNGKQCNIWCHGSNTDYLNCEGRFLLETHFYFHILPSTWILKIRQVVAIKEDTMAQTRGPSYGGDNGEILKISLNLMLTGWRNKSTVCTSLRATSQKYQLFTQQHVPNAEKSSDLCLKKLQTYKTNLTEMEAWMFYKSW